MRLALTLLLATLATTVADQAPPAESSPPQPALKYHTALLRAPHNATLFGRFYDAWLDEQALDSLATFLSTRAENGNSQDLAILARFQLRRGLNDDALITLGKALTARADDHPLLLERARILLARLDFTSARKDLEAATASPDAALSIEAGTLIGKSHLREGNPTAATEAWEKLIAKHPANTDILEDLVELTATSDQPEQAITYSRRLIAATADAFRKTQHQLRLGEILADSGKSEEALALWSETLAQTGEGSWLEKEIIARITTAFRRLDRIDALSEKLAELSTANPRRLLIHRELAKLEAAEGKLDSAIGRFREVLRRSPGDPELREEFIRLLIDSQRFNDAAAELEKMIALAPENPDLHLRMADLANRRAEADPDRANDSPPPPEVLAALQKALALMPPGEPSGIRIAGLMLTYGLNAEGEKLLSSLSSAPDASTAPAEALAAEYARTERKEQALEILTQIAKSPDIDTVLRATSSIASLGKADASFTIITARLTDFQNQPAFLTALAQASLAAKKPSEAIAPALRLVRIATSPQEILDATRITVSVIAASEKTDAEIAALTARNDRTPSETCLLAALLETKPDPTATDALFKATTDPALLRFHASLLSRRGDPIAAIAALRSLNPDSSKPDFLKELAELQLRAGLASDCLTTLDQWKTAAPTAREPWIIASRLLRESGKHAQAIETTRRALTRFPGDEDFTSSLADLLQISGDHTEAERIFWKLYDQAQDSAAQSRWAARLSSLAQRTGANNELAEKFLARARTNPRSTGPILALVELARSTGDRNSIRDHLARALFIKPGDIDIRIQLAEAEAAAGNPQAQIAVLSEGIAKDPAGRLRTALAQAYISGGEVMKGMRILRALAGERASDPRATESVVTSLHAKGLVPEAIQYLREALPDGGDWRTKYLLALMLLEDGREPEAIPVFLPLLSEETEITNITPALGYGAGYNHDPFDPHRSISRQGQHNPALMEISLLSQAAQTAGRVTDRRQGPISQFLPAAVAQLRAQALIQLAAIASSGNTPAAEAITAANPPNLAFAIDLIDSYKAGYPDFISLLEKHPELPGLLEMVWNSGSFQQGIEKRIPLLKRILATSEPAAHFHFTLLITLARLEPDEPEHLDQIITLATKTLPSDDISQTNQVIQQLLNFILNPTAEVTPDHISSIKEILLEYATKPSHPPEFDHLRLSILAHTGTRAQWIAAVNAAIAAHRSTPKPASNQIPQIHYRHSPWQSRQHHYFSSGLFALPFSSIPPGLISHITSEKTQSSPSGNPVTAQELLTKLDQLDSPLLRAHVAIVSGDEKAIAKTLNAPHPAAEATDFEFLRASREISAGRLVEACRIYVKIRESAAAGTPLAQMSNSILVSNATKLTPEQRVEFEPALRSALTALIPPQGPYRDASNIIQMATEFGFTDIVKSLTPAPPTRNPTLSGSAPARIGLPAAITPPSPRRRPQPSSSPIDRFREFAREEKTAAAAREFLRWAGDMNRSGNSLDYIAREAEKSMTPAIKAEILAITNPGESPSLTKHRAYIDICLALGDREIALAALTALAEERPFDPSVTIDLAFLLPPAESERASSLLARAASAPQLTNSINSAYNRARQSKNKAEVMAFFGLITTYFEHPASTKTSLNDLNRMTSLARDLFTGRIVEGMQPLLKNDRPDNKQPAPDPADIALARRLALAMLRHPVFAETGFSLLNSAIWEEKPADLDEWARSAILLSASINSNGRYYSSSNPFPNKSPIQHLLSRLAASTPDILPAAYLDSLAAHDPQLPTLLRFHSTPATAESIAALWDSGAMKYSQTPTTQTLQQASYKRAAATPGASRFFLNRIREFMKKDTEKEPNPDPFGQGRLTLVQLLRAALETCASLDEKGVAETCTTIATILLPEDQPDTNGQNQYLAINTLREVLGSFNTDPRTAARIIRAFDSSSTPIPSDWLRSCFQTLQNMKPAAVVETLAAMGLLADAPSWKPLASTDSQYTHTSGKFTFTRLRNDQLKNITERVNSSHRKEITTLLENRKPQTFGSLITAAHFTSGTERERLAAAAFKLAAPTLKKANARRLDDFALHVSLLPHSATATLPPQLRDLALADRAEKAETLAKSAKLQIEQYNQSLQNPLGSILNTIPQLAILDLPKAVELFLEATEIYLASASRFANQGNTHEDALDSILRHLSSSANPDPETALLFYQAVLASPSGPRFGISNKSNNECFLSIIGEAIGRKVTGPSNWSSAKTREVWLAAQKFPAETRINALAAVATRLTNNNSYLSHEHVRKMIADFTDPDAKAFALAVTSLRNWENEKPEARAAISQAFATLLARPDLSANARAQIALTAASRLHDILSDPAIAAAVADIFAAHCAREASAVSNMPLSIVTRIGRNPIPPETLPHLKHINDAFWKNANSPLPGGHPPISESYTAPLFQTAMALGDTATSKRLFPIIQPALSGKANAILSMISSGHFEYAIALMPDGNTRYDYEQINARYTPELEESIAAFAKSGVPPSHLLRLQTMLLPLRNIDGRQPDPVEIAGRKEALITAYIANPPTGKLEKQEILANLATSTNPSDSPLSGEVSSAAATLDPLKTLRDWDSSNEGRYTAPASWNLLCKAAAIQLRAGDNSGFVSLADALTTHAKTSRDSSATRYGLRSFNHYLFPATCFAVLEKQPGGFAGLVTPLASLVVGFSKIESYDRFQIIETLALCEFFAAWDGKRDIIPETIENIVIFRHQYEENFALPRSKNHFANLLHTIKHRDAVIAFLTAYLTRPGFSDILPTEKSLPNICVDADFPKEVLALAEGPQEAFSPGGRAVLSFHRAMQWPKSEEAFRICLAEMPVGKPWDHLRGTCKIILATELLRDPEKHADARELFDSVLPEEISPRYKSAYAILNKRFPQKAE